MHRGTGRVGERAAGLSSTGPRPGVCCLNGLWISEAWVSTPRISVSSGVTDPAGRRRGGKHVTIPLAPRTPRAIDLAISEREHGPILLGTAGQRLDGPATASTATPHTSCPPWSPAPPDNPPRRYPPGAAIPGGQHRCAVRRTGHYRAGRSRTSLGVSGCGCVEVSGSAATVITSRTRSVPRVPAGSRGWASPGANT